jgi:carbonic anhydrase/acetyltransferase-like protein (isoleucine patch superfamily)
MISPYGIQVNKVRQQDWKNVAIGMPIIELDGKKPRIDPTAFVAPNATIIGDVEIGEGTSIWYGAVIRGDLAKIRIGKFNTIQDNSVIHGDGPTTIGDNCVLAHGCCVHGATIGSRSLISINAIVFDRAVIGEESIVGLGAVVLANTKVPPRTVMGGVPAKPLRQATDNDVAGVKLGNKGYIDLSRRYKAQKLG